MIATGAVGIGFMIRGFLEADLSWQGRWVVLGVGAVIGLIGAGVTWFQLR